MFCNRLPGEVRGVDTVGVSGNYKGGSAGGASIGKLTSELDSVLQMMLLNDVRCRYCSAC